jgi:hypothetical protein
MNQRLSFFSASFAFLLVSLFLSTPVFAQGGRGPWWAQENENQRGPGWRGGRGGGPPGGGRRPRWRGGRQNEQFVADRDTFHSLLANHDKITRTVKMRKDGVVTVTESDDADVASKIREHAEAMHARVTQNNPIRRRDPLFDALFAHAEHIKMKVKKTDNGVKVVETSHDPYTVKLIQAHAQVVSLFVEKGFLEAPKNHEVPE